MAWNPERKRWECDNCGDAEYSHYKGGFCVVGLDGPELSRKCNCPEFELKNVHGGVIGNSLFHVFKPCGQ